mmetsp:Transcript_29630/g.43919  ORF Transcript_29630/g.43919 Transcript_29630/m.43919 type:complete len:100 (+) Transcript_29630:477-776(+)
MIKSKMAMKKHDVVPIDLQSFNYNHPTIFFTIMHLNMQSPSFKLPEILETDIPLSSNRTTKKYSIIPLVTCWTYNVTISAEKCKHMHILEVACLSITAV